MLRNTETYQLFFLILFQHKIYNYKASLSSHFRQENKSCLALVFVWVHLHLRKQSHITLHSITIRFIQIAQTCYSVKSFVPPPFKKRKEHTLKQLVNWNCKRCNSDSRRVCNIETISMNTLIKMISNNKTNSQITQAQLPFFHLHKTTFAIDLRTQCK
jgi:hypothetical protein